MKMQSSNRLPNKISIPRGSIVVLRNVVFPRDTSQSGVKSRFKVVFYRSNKLNKPRFLLLLRGPKEVFIAPPRLGRSFAFHFGFRPFYLRIERLHFSSYETPLSPIGFMISRISTEYKIPNVPNFNRVSLGLTVPKMSKSYELKRKSSYLERVAPEVKLDLSRENIFKSSSINVKLLKDYESNRIF